MSQNARAWLRIVVGEHVHKAAYGDARYFNSSHRWNLKADQGPTGRRGFRAAAHCPGTCGGRIRDRRTVLGRSRLRRDKYFDLIWGSRRNRDTGCRHGLHVNHLDEIRWLPLGSTQRGQAQDSSETNLADGKFHFFPLQL